MSVGVFRNLVAGRRLAMDAIDDTAMLEYDYSVEATDRMRLSASQRRKL